MKRREDYATRRFAAFRVAALALLSCLPAASAADAPKPFHETKPLRDKTLVAWVAPANLTQRGGSVLTLIDKAEHFDAIVLGEVATAKWMAGSDFFRRTYQDQMSWPVENADSNSLVQLVITYRDDRVTLFRNGKQYATYPIGQAQPFGDDAMVSGVGEGEVGAIEKLGDKYYMMFGTGGLMVTLVADRADGPFVAARKNFQLLAGHTYFSRFFPMPDGVLANHHSIARDGQVYFGTLKATVFDDEGTLRLGWWPGNEKLKHQTIEVKSPPLRSGAVPAVAMLAPEFDGRRGLVLEGTLRLPVSQESPPVGLFLTQGNGAGTAILVHAGGVAELGPMRADGTGFKAENRIDREWKFGPSVRFRLLLKGSLLEFYLDELLMQCYSLPQETTGRIAILPAGDPAAVTALQAWRPCQLQP